MNEPLSAILPLVAFLISFLASFTIFSKTEILSDKKFLNILISFLIAAFFATEAIGLELTKVILPAFGILSVGVIFILAMAGFVEADKGFYKSIGLGFVALIILTFALTSFTFFLDIGEKALNSGASYPPLITNSLLFVLTGGGLCWAFLRKGY